VKRCNVIAVWVTNLIAYPLMVLWTLAVFPLFLCILPICTILLRWKMDRTVRFFVWLYGRGWVIFMSPFTRFRREGIDRIDFSQPVILVSNHLSFFDSYFMGGLPAVSDLVFVVRAWPFRMFWYTLVMRLARYPDVESFDWEVTEALCRTALERGSSLLFFPEGHRSRNGRLQRFYSGAFKLATETGVPVVPLCITGTDRMLPPGRFRLCPTRVCLRALPAVDPADFPGPLGHRQMRRHIHTLMSETIESMNGNAS
jgi:1-acyl-sn-glycerol-3-phosphate acyltransferase